MLVGEPFCIQITPVIRYYIYSHQDDLVLEYLDLVKQSPPHSRGRTSVPCLRGHMFKCLFTAMAVRTDLRAKLTKARTVDEMVRCTAIFH